MARDEENKNDGEHKEKLVTLEVNNKPVEMAKGEHTGAEIKAAAIAQDVAIQAHFILSLVKGNGEKPRIIGDTDTVKIHENMAFRAVDGDDNS